MTSFLKWFSINVLFCFGIFLLISGNEYSDTSNEGLTLACGLADSTSRYIFVSTLDGKLTAINPNDDGSVLWSIHPGDESMLSSNIHKLELSNYGHLVRMIPSLSGGLYKFNGENIEVIPVTADHLLQSSFRYSDDLVISGGKETRTFGVSLRSGNIIYECSMKGCGNVSHSTDNHEILVIQRLGQTVRAVEPRTGVEKWNFSVAQHDLKLLSECHSTKQPKLNYNIKIIVPEGIIYEVNSKEPSNIFWQHKFNSPIVSAWQLNEGKLIEINLFDGYQSLESHSIMSPSIYIGMHDKQLYIQESAMMLRKRHELISKFKHKLITSETNYPRIPWKPISAGSTSVDIFYQAERNKDNTLDDVSQQQTTALSVLYASPYVDGSGFYLYSEEELEKIKKGACNVSSDNEILNEESEELEYAPDFTNDFSEANTPVEIVIVSFWYYWKEVLVISFTTALLCNLMITRTYLKWKIKGLKKVSETSKAGLNFQENDSGVDVNVDLFNNASDFLTVQSYKSRYLTDFDPVACLGKGGFGVVFEAKNKIDDCHYAIKRILLPNKLESRDRVMREVKALAKLDHHHIVRYFNAWTECPPPGWQEKYDESWIEMNSDVFTSNDLTSEITTITSDYKRSSVFLNFDSASDHMKKVNFSYDPMYDTSDSFIIFNNDNQSNDYKKSDNIGQDVEITFSSEIEELEKVRHSKTLSKSEQQLFNSGSSLQSQKSNKVYLYIQMQLCQKQSLKDWLFINMERDYKNVLNIFEQILQAVEHVHLHELIHRDLKPSNIFFSLDNQIKVGDFGLVTAMTEGNVQISSSESQLYNTQKEKHTAQVGTQLYMSQEQLLGKPYNYKVDIYSLGLILFELLVPFSTEMERVRVLQDIKHDKFPEDFIKNYKKEYELLRLMLSHCPDKRPTTYGVRARLPLKQNSVEKSWHFELPVRQRSLSKTYYASTSNNEEVLDLQ